MSTPNYLIITGDNCPYCDKAKAELAQYGHTYSALNIYDYPELQIVMQGLGATKVPQVMKVIGGYDRTAEHLEDRATVEKLKDMLRNLADQADQDMPEHARTKHFVTALQEARALAGEA